MLKQLYADVTALLEKHHANAHTKAEVDRIFDLESKAQAAAQPAPTPAPTPTPTAGDGGPSTVQPDPSVVNGGPDDGGGQP